MRGRVELGEERWPEALEVFREAWSRITAPAEYGELPRDPLGGLRATRWERSEPKAKLLNKPRASLVMERVPLATTSDAKVEQEDGTLWETEECECDDDNACLSLTGAKDQMSQHYYDFHILYNASFRVPELFLLGYREDGSVLTLDEVVHDFSSMTEYSQAALSSVFVEKEHPLLLLPWIGTHLCETSGLVSKMLLEGQHQHQHQHQHQRQDDDGNQPSSVGFRGLGLTSQKPLNALRYMLSWWSSVGKYVGLHLPLDRVKKINFTGG